MKTNFQEWCYRYGEVLLPYYHRFCVMFEPETEPSFHQFMVHCFRNTKQTYDHVKKKWSAPIY
jgi:hypothetical protein